MFFFTYLWGKKATFFVLDMQKIFILYYMVFVSVGIKTSSYIIFIHL